MKEKLHDFFHSDASNFIIASITKIEALTIIYAFTIGFIDNVLRGRTGKNHLFDPITLVIIILLLGYDLYLSYFAYCKEVLSEQAKLIISLATPFLLALTALINASNILSTFTTSTKTTFSPYQLYVYVFSLIFFGISMTRLTVIFESTGSLLQKHSDGFMTIGKKNIMNKIQDYQMTILQFIMLPLIAVLIYTLFRSFNSISFTILQTYFFTTLIVKLFKTSKNSQPIYGQ